MKFYTINKPVIKSKQKDKSKNQYLGTMELESENALTLRNGKIELLREATSLENLGREALDFKDTLTNFIGCTCRCFKNRELLINFQFYLLLPEKEKRNLLPVLLSFPLRANVSDPTVDKIIFFNNASRLQPD